MDVLYTLLLAEKLNKGRGPGRGLLQVGPDRRAGGFLWHLKIVKNKIKTDVFHTWRLLSASWRALRSLWVPVGGKSEHFVSQTASKKRQPSDFLQN